MRSTQKFIHTIANHAFIIQIDQWIAVVCDQTMLRCNDEHVDSFAHKFLETCAVLNRSASPPYSTGARITSVKNGRISA